MEVPRCFYYMTHVDNLKSILKSGILSRNRVQGFPFKIFHPKQKSIHDEGIIQRRKDRLFKEKSLWSYVNLYFQIRNSMLYRVIKRYGASNIVILQINSDIIKGNDIGIADGNAASYETRLFKDINKGLRSLDRKVFSKRSWKGHDGLERKMMAELLVYDHVPKEKIIAIYVANEEDADQIRKKITGSLNVIPDKDMFFL